MSWVQTRSGKKVDFLDPDKEQIDIGDIAHALALQYRYNGHTPYPYSVAAHAIACSYAPDILSERVRMGLLLHDASEAYMSDIPGPLKDFLPDYREIEKRMMDAICQKFFIVNVMANPIIKEVDQRVLATEHEEVFPPGATGHWLKVKDPYPADWCGRKFMRPDYAGSDWKKVKHMFLQRYAELTGMHLDARESFLKHHTHE